MKHEQETSISLLVKLCSDKAAYEVRMKNNLAFDMEKARKLLEAGDDHQITVYTPHMIILRSGKAEVTFSRDGRILVKKVSSETEATQVASEIFQIALSAAVKP